MIKRKEKEREIEVLHNDEDNCDINIEVNLPEVNRAAQSSRNTADNDIKIKVNMPCMCDLNSCICGLSFYIRVDLSNDRMLYCYLPKEEYVNSTVKERFKPKVIHLKRRYACKLCPAKFGLKYTLRDNVVLCQIMIHCKCMKTYAHH